MSENQQTWYSSLCTRRDFVRLATGVAAAVVPFRLRAQQRPERVSLHIGLLYTSGSAPDLRHGFDMGVAEAARGAELVGSTIRHSTGANVQALVTTGCTVIVSAVSGAAGANEAARAASANRVVLLNAAAAADSLRDAECGEFAFHVVPSNAMGRSGAARRRLVAWDARLTRFGAEQLNDRYRHRYGSPMTAAAWCGWMAAKIAWDSAARAGSSRGADVQRHLLRHLSGFDGHKGRALRFDAGDRQLYQPLYDPTDLSEVRPEPPIAGHGRAACGR